MALIQCKSCGAAISDKAQSCPKCGQQIMSRGNNAIPAYQQLNTSYTTQKPQTANSENKPNVWQCILSFCVPITGWILYFILRKKEPIQAKAYAKWAWIGFGVFFVLDFINGFLSEL